MKRAVRAKVAHLRDRVAIAIAFQVIRARMQAADGVATGVGPNVEDNKESSRGAGVGQHCQPLRARGNNEPAGRRDPGTGSDGIRQH